MRGYAQMNIKCLIQLIFCLFLTFTSITTIFSQTSKIVRGNITDSVGVPIEMAVIYTKSSIDSSFIRFTNSNEKGDFTIVVPLDFLKITLNINHLGYKPISHFLSVDTLIHDLVFQLSPQSNHIKEIVIKAERERIVEQGDTLSYHLKDFRDSSEYSIEDLLRKLPGIEISAEGRIKANGKEIKTVLLEGDDMFGRQYTIGTKNIRATAIEQVDVIKKYEDNPVLKGIKQSDDVVLNLKLSQNKKNILNGNSDVGLGAGIDEPKEMVHLNVFDITRKFKSILLSDNGNVIQTLNLGELSAIYGKPLSEDDTKNAIWSKSDLTSPPNISNPGVPNDFIDNALNTFSTVRNVIKPNEHLKIGLNANFAYNKDQQQSVQYQSYLYDSSRYNFEISSHLYASKRIFDVEGNLQYNRPNQKTNFQLTTKYYNTFSSSNQKIDNRQQAFKNNFFINNSNLLVNGLFSQKLSDNSVIQILIKSQLSQSLEMTSLQNENFKIFSFSDSLLQINQSVRNPNKGVLINGQYIKNWGKLICQLETGWDKIINSFNQKWNYTRLDDNLDINRLSINQALSTNIYFNKILLKYHFSPSAAVKIDFARKSRTIIVNNNANDNYTLNAVVANTSFEFDKVLLGRIVFVFNWRQDMPTTNNFFNIPYFKDAFNRYIPLVTNVNNYSQSMYANYSYKNTFKNRFFNINMIVDLKQDIWRESFVFNSSIQEISPFYAEGNQNMRLNGNFSQFFPSIKTGFELKGGYSLSKTILNIQNINMPVRSLNYHVNPSIRIALKYFLKLNISNDYSLIINQNQFSKNSNRFISNKFSSQLFYNLENWNISLSVNHFSNKNNSAYNTNLLTSNFSLARKIVLNKKESTLQLQLYNLNFAKRYTSNFNDNILFFRNSIEAVAPFFILKYDFSF
jgi:hypothetical protein